MKLKAFRLSQKNKDLYVTVLNAAEVLGKAKADVWSPETKTGYQRELSPSRARKASKYLLNKEGVFPQSIVLNVRQPVKFSVQEDFGSMQFGNLDIPSDSILWEVDGQHRLEGLTLAIHNNPEFSKYPVSITITNFTDPYDEMKQFYVINTEMKGVRSDLAERLISEMVAKEGESHYKKEGRSRELMIARANKVVDLLNLTVGQPWHNAIQLPNQEKKANHLIAQRSMVTSLKPVLRSTEGDDADTVAKMVINYWKAIRLRYPKAFENAQDYLIQKTLGVFVFHMLFPKVKSICGSDFRVETIKRVLDQIEGDDQSWHKAGEYKPYGGMKGFNYLATELEGFLENTKPAVKF